MRPATACDVRAHMDAMYRACARIRRLVALFAPCRLAANAIPFVGPSANATVTGTGFTPEGIDQVRWHSPLE